MFEPIGIKDSSMELKSIKNGWNISEGSRPYNCISKLWLVCSYPSLMAAGDSLRLGVKITGE